MMNKIFPKEKETQAIEQPLLDGEIVLDPIAIKELVDIFGLLIKWRDEALNTIKIKEAA